MSFPCPDLSYNILQKVFRLLHLTGCLSLSCGVESERITGTGDIIDAAIVVFRQCQQAVYRNPQAAGLVVAVGTLRDSKNLCYIFLGEIPFFPHTTKSFCIAHNVSPWFEINVYSRYKKYIQKQKTKRRFSAINTKDFLRRIRCRIRNEKSSKTGGVSVIMDT